MEFHRTSGPIGDPFFDEVHRRHPDVDIVVLPPEPAPGPAAGPVEVVDEQVARDLRDRTAAETARLWAAMHEDPSQAPADTRGRLAPGRTPGTVVPAARATRRGTDDGRRMLSRLAGELDGWDVRRLPGPVERLQADRGGASVQASWASATGVVSLEVKGSAVHVGTAAVHRLVHEQGGDA